MAHSSKTGQHFPELTQATNKFAIDLYLGLRSSSENIVVSPLGLQILLAMVQQGAKGNTAAEISEVLHQPQNNQKLLECYKVMINGFHNKILKFATKIFIEETFKISPDFQKITSTYFLAEACPTKFKDNPEESRHEINDWAAKNTNNKIKDLLSPDSVGINTVLILVNAIHFKANWDSQFKHQNTSNQPFYITADHSVTVEMMAKYKEELGYANSDKLDAQLVQLPYVDQEFSMIIILPNNREGLSDVESKLESLDLSEELSLIKKQKVNFQMPKFKITQTMDLNEILSRMGMPTAFTPNADFSGISDHSLKISKVVQKAFIEVNEEGTEAAAATGMVINRRCLDISPDINCNHPFLYMVVKENNVLFFGRISNPCEI